MKITHSQLSIFEINLDLSLIEKMEMLNINGLMNFKTDWTIDELLNLKNNNSNLNKLLEYLSDNNLLSNQNNVIRILAI